MEALFWIVGAGIGMSLISLVGGITLLLPRAVHKRLLLPLVAFAAGSLLGGAFLHMLPAAHEAMPDDVAIYAWVLLGFTTFLALEQFLHWHHCHDDHAHADDRADESAPQPLTYLILVGDGLHNFLGGMAIAGTFLIDIHLGIAAWIAAAAHEIPQELGDFGVLVHGGWTSRKALLVNFLSGLTFLIGGLIVFGASRQLDVSFLVPLAAGNFIYIGATDLVPEVNKHHSARMNAALFASFVAGILLLFATRLVLAH